MANAYLGIGSNLGNRQELLLGSINLLIEKAGKISAFSPIYETAPWGYQSPHLYLNSVVQLETSLSPTELLYVIQNIESELGRMAKSKNQPYTDRTIDIDILIYDEVNMLSTDLILPHPLMHQRLFVLEPLADIAPDLLHPVLKKTIATLYNDLICNTPSN